MRQGRCGSVTAEAGLPSKGRQTTPVGQGKRLEDGGPWRPRSIAPGIAIGIVIDIVHAPLIRHGSVVVAITLPVHARGHLGADPVMPVFRTRTGWNVELPLHRHLLGVANAILDVRLAVIL